jgi:peptidoglycan lytic transglycosylase
MSLFLHGGFWSVGGGARRARLRVAANAPAQCLRVAAVLLSITSVIVAQSPARAETTASFSDRWWPESDEPIKPIRVAVIYFSRSPDAAVTARTEPPVGSVKQALQRSGEGLASFYGSDQQTANGERFNPRALTAAHRTLPFGTKVRVTNVRSGRSVTVRINDRGPFVHGRVIDVSQAAAEELGIVGRGIAKVKLDVVQ